MSETQAPASRLAAILHELDEVEQELRAAFPQALDRLHQLTSHLATVKMVVEHLYEEARR